MDKKFFRAKITKNSRLRRCSYPGRETDVGLAGKHLVYLTLTTLAIETFLKV